MNKWMNEWMNEWMKSLFILGKKHKYHDKIKMLKKPQKNPDPIRVKSNKNVKTVKNT